ncbi:unnamed protein product [Schistocephalus solidus]|uniref:BAH domain-containing protein n=1 Tax=Schistocephalus solidus TaxID=70667 RepID=A0A183SNJ2_SCHSO|nr:unnamed protein product [Schistocephalus solidus]
MSSHEEDAGTKVALAVTTTIVTSATDSSALTKEDDSKLGTMGSTQQHLAPKETRNGETAPASAVTRGKADSEEVIPKETPLRRSNRGKGRTLQIEKSGPDDRIQSCISGCIEYKPGDYVYYEEPDFDYYTIGLIEEIKLSRREKCSVVVKCFWRTRDIPEMAKQALLDREVVQQEAAAAAAMTENAGDHGAAIAEEWQQRQRRRQAILSRELFVSELQYTVYSNQLRGKCQIIQLPDLHTALRTFEPAEEDSFFFVFAYNPETRRLLSTRAEIKVRWFVDWCEARSIDTGFVAARICRQLVRDHFLPLANDQAEVVVFTALRACIAVIQMVSRSSHTSHTLDSGMCALQGRCQPPAPSLASGLLDYVMTPGPGGRGGEIAVDAAQIYYRFKLNHAQVTVPAPPFRGAFGGSRRIPRSNCRRRVGPAYQVASLPRCRRPLDPALWRHSRRRTDCRALKHRLREKNENVCRLLASTKSNGGVGSGDVVAPAEQHPHSVNGKRVSPPTTVDSTSVVGDPKRPRVKADHHHQHHRCRRHRLSETDDDSLLPAPPPRCWETLVWLPQGLRNGLKLVHGGFPGRILEDRQDSSGEDEELEGTIGVGDDSKRQGEHGVPPALNGGGILKERPAENDEDDDDFTLKTYLEAVRSLVAFCAFGGSDDDLISAENGLVLANLATTTQHAYDTLHRCGYNLANALETIKHNPIVSDDTPQHWTVEQVRRFYHAMAVRGKDFHVIHRDFFSAAAARQPRLAGGCGRRKPPPRLASPSRGKKRRGQANTVNLALLDPLVDRKPSERTDGVDPTVRPLKYSASVPNSLFSLSEDVATEEEDGEEELDDEEVEAEEQREVSEPKRPCFASDDDTKSAVAMDSANSTAVNIKSIFTKPEATDTKSGEPILVSAKPEAEEACATVTNGGQEEAKIKGETAGLDSTTTDEKTVSPAIFRPSREKTVKQLISFYYYWKRKSNSILPSASAFSSHYHSHPQQQHHQTTASFRGSCVETNFNTGISSRKKRPTGRGGVPLTVQAWSDILQGRLSAQEELSRRLLQQFHSHRHQHPLCDSPHSTISSAGICSSPCYSTVACGRATPVLYACCLRLPPLLPSASIAA